MALVGAGRRVGGVAGPPAVRAGPDRGGGDGALRAQRPRRHRGRGADLPGQPVHGLLVHVRLPGQPGPDPLLEPRRLDRPGRRPRRLAGRPDRPPDRLGRRALADPGARPIGLTTSASPVSWSVKKLGVPAVEFSKSFYSPHEVAAMASVHPSTILNYIASGHLYAVKLSERTYRIPVRAVIALLEPERLVPSSMTVQPDADVESEVADEPTGQAMSV